MLKPIRPCIRSLLETDLYKLTMLQLMLHKHPKNIATYEFLCRNATQYPLASLKEQVEDQLDWLCSLSFTADELEYLSTKPFLSFDFIEFLRIFKLQRRFIEVSTENDSLKIVAKGPQVHIMLFEIYVLAIVNELYFRSFETPAVIEEGRKRLHAKIEFMKNTLGSEENCVFEMFDFSLRRRWSREWQEEVVTTLVREIPQYCKGTSNVYLARKLGIAAIGTMAHEFFQMYQAVGVQLKNFQKTALEDWADEYQGDLGIALTDVIGMDAFCADFNLKYAKLFDGLRHDSGDPIEWGEKAIAHYRKLRIDPKSKRLVFSDGLTVQKAIEIYRHFKGQVIQGFGIGTSLGNDMGIKALNIVMKITSCNGQPVAKLSDSPGKTMCEDQVFLAYLRQVFNHHNT